MTSIKVTEPSVTATLAQPVEPDDDNSTNPVIYTNSWSTRNRLLSGKESMWRRVRIK